jgi:hypothetical protein
MNENNIILNDQSEIYEFLLSKLNKLEERNKKHQEELEKLREEPNIIETILADYHNKEIIIKNTQKLIEEQQVNINNQKNKKEKIREYAMKHVLSERFFNNWHNDTSKLNVDINLNVNINRRRAR